MAIGRLVTGAMILALLIHAQPAGAQPVVDAIQARPLPVQPTPDLPPTSAWTADFAADNCSLTRTFGDASGSVTLRLRQFAPADYIEITLVSSTFELDPDRPSYAVADGEPVRIGLFQTFRFDSGLQGVVFHAALGAASASTGERSPYAADDPDVGAVDHLAVQNVFDRGFTLRTGSLRGPMSALATCLDDLMTSWGLDAAAHHALTSSVAERVRDRPWPGQVTVPEIGRWPSDFVEFRLLVDETGGVTDCRVLNGRPEDEGLGRQICAKMPRTWRFEPARDASGTPIKSFYLPRYVRGALRSSAWFH